MDVGSEGGGHDSEMTVAEIVLEAVGSSSSPTGREDTSA